MWCCALDCELKQGSRKKQFLREEERQRRNLRGGAILRRPAKSTVCFWRGNRHARKPLSPTFSACWTWSDWTILKMPENEVFLGENNSKMPVFSSLKFLCSTCAQLTQQTIKNNLYGKIRAFRSRHSNNTQNFYLPKSYQCGILINKSATPVDF